jgi:alginate O-acetyltransferase complex protein AlgI
LLFNSITFAVFLAILLPLYWMLRFRAQNWLLLIGSWVFYAFWDWRFLGLLIFQSLIDFIAGGLMGQSDDEKFRKRVLITAIAMNLVILGFFKYFGFFVDSAIGVLEWFGLRPNPPLLKVLLPIGISFYTFQSITYSFDVFRRRLPPTKSLLNYSVFVAYFPHMVAGPIQRANHLLPQIEHARRRPNRDQIRSGLVLILVGLFRKVAIADAVAIVAGKAFAAPGNAGTGLLWLGILAFALQIYGDFAGYTDMARGVSRLFGIELTLNFEQPYLSRNITEFWRTWHISLSTWLHDYLYIPMGGNQGGRLATYRNLFVTMVLGGLWHGAAWTFVIWGAIHGGLLAIHRAMGGYVPRGHLDRLRFLDIPKILFTFLLVCLAWVFFRAIDLTTAVDYLTGMFSYRPGRVSMDDAVVVAISILFILIIDVSQRVTRDQEAVLRWAPPLRGIAYAMFILWIVLWSGGEAQPFIYFQF